MLLWVVWEFRKIVRSPRNLHFNWNSMGEGGWYLTVTFMNARGVRWKIPYPPRMSAPPAHHLLLLAHSDSFYSIRRPRDCVSLEDMMN